MKPPKTLKTILTSTATLAITALAITTTTATANPTILPTPTTEAPLKFTSEAGKIAFVFAKEGGEETIECEKFKAEGNFTTSETGKTKINFEDCKAKGLGAKCKTGTDTNGTFLVEPTITVVDIGSTLGLGLLLTPPEAVKITCGALGFEVKGSLIAKVDGVSSLVKTKTATLLLHEVAKKQEVKECNLLEAICLKEGKHIVYELLSRFNEAEAFKEARETAESKITFAKEAEIHF